MGRLAQLGYEGDFALEFELGTAELAMGGTSSVIKLMTTLHRHVLNYRYDYLMTSSVIK